MKRNFEHLVQEIWPLMCVPIILILKKQIKSENYKICHDVIVSHMKTMIKSWEEFAHFVITIFTKLKHLTRMCDCMWELVDVFIEYKPFIWSYMKKKHYTKAVHLNEI